MPRAVAGLIVPYPGCQPHARESRGSQARRQLVAPPLSSRITPSAASSSRMRSDSAQSLRERAAVRAAAATDVRAVRKAAQRLHDLEQLRAVLSRELHVSG